MVGVCKSSVQPGGGTVNLFNTHDAWCLYANDGGLYGNGRSGSDRNKAGAFAQGDRVGCKLDLGAGTLAFYKNGVKHGPGHTGVAGPVKRCVELYHQNDRVTLLQRAAAFAD